MISTQNKFKSGREPLGIFDLCFCPTVCRNFSKVKRVDVFTLLVRLMMMCGSSLHDFWHFNLNKRCFSVNIAYV